MAALLAPTWRGRAAAQARQTVFTAEVGVLFDVFSFKLEGRIEELTDFAGGTYRVSAAGQGSGIANRIESRGVLRAGRWAPLSTESWFSVRGREYRSEIAYDFARQAVEYHHRGETFLLRRRRVADDLLPLPASLHLDDMLSAVLNYADRRWRPEPDGSFRTHLVRRQRTEQEGPDDVQKHYGAEIVPFDLRVSEDPTLRRPAAWIDLTRFSSWARPGAPARVVLGPDRRPELITSTLILGSGVTVRFTAV